MEGHARSDQIEASRRPVCGNLRGIQASILDTERVRGFMAARIGNLRRGKVDAHDVRVALSQPAREPALATSDIEHALATDVVTRLQQSWAMHLRAPVVEPGLDEVVPGRGRGIPGRSGVGNQG